MSEFIEFTIDGKECMAEKGQYLIAAARKNGMYIPSLCNIDGVTPRGACRICTVKVNGKFMTACTTPVSDGMKIENDTPELKEIRTQIVELLFAEGNHFCPACEKSGTCELQALAYRFGIAVPRFPLNHELREIEASNPKIIKDHNRCILCKRCIRTIIDEQGRRLFAFRRRSQNLTISVDTQLASSISDELAQKAMDICPVGAILRKERGFSVPIGKRKYDMSPIGSDVEKETTDTVPEVK